MSSFTFYCPTKSTRGKCCERKMFHSTNWSKVSYYESALAKRKGKLGDFMTLDFALAILFLLLWAERVVLWVTVDPEMKAKVQKRCRWSAGLTFHLLSVCCKIARDFFRVCTTFWFVLFIERWKRSTEHSSTFRSPTKKDELKHCAQNEEIFLVTPKQ